jgi:hypothetical protein
VKRRKVYLKGHLSLCNTATEKNKRPTLPPESRIVYRSNPSFTATRSLSRIWTVLTPQNIHSFIFVVLKKKTIYDWTNVKSWRLNIKKERQFPSGDNNDERGTLFHSCWIYKQRNNGMQQLARSFKCYFPNSWTVEEGTFSLIFMHKLFNLFNLKPEVGLNLLKLDLPTYHSLC